MTVEVEKMLREERDAARAELASLKEAAKKVLMDHAHAVSLAAARADDDIEEMMAFAGDAWEHSFNLAGGLVDAIGLAPEEKAKWADAIGATKDADLAPAPTKCPKCLAKESN
jgi:hypothetical protein